MLRPSTIPALPTMAIVAALALVACSKSAAPESTPAEPASAPAVEVAPAPRPESSKSFQIGELSALALRDGTLEIPNDNQVFGVGQTPEAVAALLSAAGQPTDKLHLDINPLLVRSGEHVLLFDTGAGSSFGPTAGMLRASLAAAGIDPLSITDIFISHVHGDHVGGLVDAQGALLFPNATIHLSKPEWKFLTGMDAERAKSVGLGQRDALVAAIKPKVVPFTPGAQLVPGIVKAVEIKGHTPGHSGYLITSGRDSLLYVGDSMHHFVISVQKPQWTNSFDTDHALAAASRAALIAQLAGDGQRLYAVHFPFPAVGKIVKQGDVFTWVGEQP